MAIDLILSFYPNLALGTKLMPFCIHNPLVIVIIFYLKEYEMKAHESKVKIKRLKFIYLQKVTCI